MQITKVLYVLSDLRRVGPTNQTLNIILNCGVSVKKIKVLTLFKEPGKTMMQEYLDHGIIIESLALTRGNYVNICRRLCEYIKRENPQIVHSYGTKPDICLFVASRFINFIHIITARNIPMEDYLPRMGRIVGTIVAKIHTFVMRHSSYVVACSKTVANVLNNVYGCDNVFVIQNGVDTERFHSTMGKRIIRRNLGLPLEGKFFISTGFFTPRKHINNIVDAFLNLNDDKSFLILLGDGPLFSGMQLKYAKNEQVFFKGLVPNVSEYLSASDVFVSASDSEGLPNAVLEAIACNLRVVLSDIPQHKEILDELGDVGHLFRLGNISDIVKMMKKERDSPLKDEMVKLLSSPFTMKKMGETYGEYYKKLISKFS